MRACLGDTTQFNILEVICCLPPTLPGLESKHSEWMGGLPSAVTHLYAGDAFLPSPPPNPHAPHFHLLWRYFYFAFFIWFLQVSLLPLSPSFAPFLPLPSDVCPLTSPIRFSPVIRLKVKITSISFSGHFCLLTSAGIWRNKQRGENRTTVREVMEPFLTKLFGVCVMKHANEAPSQDSMETLFLSNPISAQQPRSTKGPDWSLSLASGRSRPKMSPALAWSSLLLHAHSSAMRPSKWTTCCYGKCLSW